MFSCKKSPKKQSNDRGITSHGHHNQTSLCGLAPKDEGRVDEAKIQIRQGHAINSTERTRKKFPPNLAPIKSSRIHITNYMRLENFLNLSRDAIYNIYIDIYKWW